MESLDNYASPTLEEMQAKINEIVKWINTPEITGTPKEGMKHPEHICRFNDVEQSCECYNAGFEAGKFAVYGSVGLLRQWLNENRITDPKKMVSSEELLYWLNLKK